MGDTALGEAHAKYLIRFDKDLHQELVEPEFVERVHVDVLQFFWSHRGNFPQWYEVVCVLALLHPTSAAAERVFSLLQAFFGAGLRCNSLHDLVNTTLKLRYNA